MSWVDYMALLRAPINFAHDALPAGGENAILAMRVHFALAVRYTDVPGLEDVSRH